ncbi:hypothetical protein BC939DRAFT_482217 [Gamsiella multidivaricata]|uniref:uncharacterized protein n=1 Tax=Gamsiella multidivaricata TaxID=101098 RepID=UPI00221F9525|nr:uncharacterized protein BC939DRAFT_482217 [Gamsiella multidivaricata]KAG0351067.1 hypothetical protein BGZ54_003430 [Gamsiella multidivaricata]KAI7816238.1 hypothetical protein BC939DRAFT_482217 [Gamsiella multidivaricata]
MADHSELIANFVGVVGSTPEQAEFYLEANNWDINAALSNFYEEPEAASAPAAGSRGRAKAATAQDDDDDDYMDEDDEDLEDIMARTTPRTASSSAAEGKRKAKADSSASGRRQGGIATFRDLSKSEDEEEEDEDEDSQNYFAGGEKSGVMVQGPPGKKDPNALVEDILKKAAKGGQRHEEEAEQPTPKKSFFTGAGNRLGNEAESSTSVAQPQVPVRLTPSPEVLETVTRNLTFWRNGYSLEDGPLMSYTDPANREFLDAINRGQAPLKYLNIKPGQPVEMRVAKRMDEDYKEPPKAPPKPFEGAGNRLGSVVSPATSSSNTPGSFPGGSSSNAQDIPTPRTVQIDESQPVTSIQIRLGDGGRMVARFNHTHTVNDIRGYINASSPGESSRAYVLQTSFPKKDLDDVHQTIKDAGLINAVVIQRYV